MNPYKRAELEHKFLMDQEVSGDYLGTSKPNKEQIKGKGNLPYFKDANNYYCSECGNCVDSLGMNIPRKRLSKWDFMKAKPILGNCCNSY